MMQTLLKQLPYLLICFWLLLYKKQYCNVAMPQFSVGWQVIQTGRVNAVFSYYDKTEQLVVSTHVVVYAHKQGMMSFYSKSLNLPLLSSHHKHHIKWNQGLHSMGTSYLHQPTPKTACTEALIFECIQTRTIEIYLIRWCDAFMKPESSAPVVRCLALLFHHILQEGRKKLINNHRIRDVRQANFQYITCQQNQGNNGIQTYFSHGNCLLTYCTSDIK